LIAGLRPNPSTKIWKGYDRAIPLLDATGAVPSIAILGNPGNNNSQRSVHMEFTILLSFFIHAQAYVVLFHWPGAITLMSSLFLVLGEAYTSYREPMNSCDRCHTQIPAKTARNEHPIRFCPLCGGSVTLGQSLRVCHKCAKPGGDYCTTCGEPTLVCYYAHQAYPSNPRPVDACNVRICKQGHIWHISSGRYCSQCGGETTEKQHPYLGCPTCGHCSSLYSPGSPIGFCSNCGTPLQIYS
jgi:hypothetical protein